MFAVHATPTEAAKQPGRGVTAHTCTQGICCRDRLPLTTVHVKVGECGLQQCTSDRHSARAHALYRSPSLHRHAEWGCGWAEYALLRVQTREALVMKRDADTQGTRQMRPASTHLPTMSCMGSGRWGPSRPCTCGPHRTEQLPPSQRHQLAKAVRNHNNN